MVYPSVVALVNAGEVNSIALGFANVNIRASGGKTIMKIM